MTEEKQTLESRIELLTAQLQDLHRKVENIESRLMMSEQGVPPVQELPVKQKPASVVASVMRDTEAPEEISEELLDMAGKAALLPRLSTLCFLLVIALILRTITDSGLVNALLGSSLGMGFAAACMATGWYKYSKGSLLAPVFSACGAVLMATIVVETHTKFQTLPLLPAYLTLIATGVCMAIISYRFNAVTSITFGTLGMCLASVAIDYPNPIFHYLALVLLSANILGYFATRIQRCAWLRWLVLVVTLEMQHLWSFKLASVLFKKETPPAALGVEWFLPIIGIFSVTYLAIALAGVLRSGTERVSRFDFSLPTVNLVWGFTSSFYFMYAQGSNLKILGVIGVLVALGHLGVAYWLANRKMAGAPGTNSFTFAGSVLLAMALPAVVGNVTVTLPVISAIALGLAYISNLWKSGGVRVTSYILQVYSVVAVGAGLYAGQPSDNPVVVIVVASIVAALALAQYRMCRAIRPPAESAIFSRFDAKDRSAAVLLIASLASSFFVLRTVLYKILTMTGGDVTIAFRCYQSTIINCAAAILMVLAFKAKNREWRNIAILITIIAAGKVFIYDLFGSRGVPLVISVFSFGLAAAVESIVLSRWQGTVEDLAEEGGNEEIGGGKRVKEEPVA